MNKQQLAQDVLYRHSVHLVWKALTESNELSRWLLPNDFVAQVGHCFTFISEACDGWNGIIYCEVVEVEAPYRLAYTWLAHPRLPAMLISFTLKTIPQGTLLRLEQSTSSSTGWHTTLIREALPSLHLSLGGLPAMSRFFRIMVDEIALTDALFDFVTDPQISRNDRPVVEELHTFAPEMVSVLEHMILDGVQERQHISDYVHFVFGYMSV